MANNKTLIEIRKASENDLERLNALLEALNEQKDDYYFVRCLKEQEQGKRVLFLLMLDGRDIGYGMLNWQPQYNLYQRLNIPEIQDLNVLTAMRQNGAASAFIKYCENLARKQGRNQLGISVGLHAEFGPAQRLYFKHGFMPDGYGVTYDREIVKAGEIRPVDDNLCLMLVKDLA